MCNRPWQRSALVLLAAALSACAGLRTPPPEGPSQRIVVYTASDWWTAPEVATRAARLSGVPVHEALEIGPMRYRVTLLCADNDSCGAAMTRIRADKTFALGVDAIGRVQIPEKPSRESSR
jgi:hypothetical protein